MTYVAHPSKRAILTALLLFPGLLVAGAAARAAGPEGMTFFLTSIGSGKGADARSQLTGISPPLTRISDWPRILLAVAKRLCVTSRMRYG